MLRVHRLAASLLALLLSSAFCVADDPPIFSGPQVGERLMPLEVMLAYGDQRGQTVDLVERADGKPTMLVIVNGANRPSSMLTLVLMHYAEMRSSEELDAAVVWLTEDQSGAEKYLQGAVSWWGIEAPLGISTDGPEGPGSYGFNRNVNVTVLVANKNRVTANFALVQPSISDVPKILQEVTRQAGGHVPTAAEISYLRHPTQSIGKVKWQPAPSDIDLRKQLCALLAADDDLSAAQAAREVEAYVGQDKWRQSDLGIAAQLLAPHKQPSKKSRYRDSTSKGHATKYLQQWRDEYAPPEASGD